MEIIATSTALPEPSPTAAEQIPEALVYERSAKRAYYYKGYREALNHTQTVESVMAENLLQSWLKAQLSALLIAQLVQTKYEVFAGELGLLLGNGRSRGADVSIFDGENLVLTGHFAKTPPEIVIEVDIQTELEPQGELDYVAEKVDDYLQFGVKKVIWIFTSSRKIMVAEPQQP